MKVELLEIYWHGDRTRISSIDFYPNSSFLASAGVEDEERLYIRVPTILPPVVLVSLRQS